MCKEGIGSVTYIMVSNYNNGIMFLSQMCIQIGNVQQNKTAELMQNLQKHNKKNLFNIQSL